MRLVALLVFATGCQLVFELDEAVPDAASAFGFRRVVSADSDQQITLTFDRAAEIADSDLLIAMVHSPDADETEVTVAPPGFEKLAEGVAEGCNDDWHTTYYAGLAGAATSYEFLFTTIESHYGLITAYASAARASFVIHRDPEQLEQSAVLPASATAAGAILWIGGAASEAWDDDQTPAAMTKRSSNRTLAVFDQTLPDGVIPEIEIATSFNFCAGVAEIAIEP